MIVGGAQENTLSTVEIQSERKDFKVDLIFGTETGPEGSLLYSQHNINRSYNLITVPQMVRNIHPVKDVKALYKLYQIFKENKYDVVHTHSSKAGIIGRIAAKLAGVEVVVHTIHGLPFHPYQNFLKNKLYIFLEKLAARFCKRILTVCDVMKEKAVAAEIAPKSRFETVYSGTDLDAFLKAGETFSKNETRESLGISPEKFVVVKVARLFELKGHSDLIKAAKQVVEKNKDVVFLLVGDGNLKETLLKEIQEAGLEKYFVFTGLVPPQKVPELINCADMLVHCSKREGLARVLAYGLACKIPAVSYDIDGACEIIEDGVTGYLVSADKTEKIAEAISNVFNNKDNIIKTAAEKGPQKVDPIFRKEYMTEHINRIYKEIAESN